MQIADLFQSSQLLENKLQNALNMKKLSTSDLILKMTKDILLKSFLQASKPSKKNTIVVLGKMGHGKSSFIKMLVSSEDKQKIKIGAGTDSITKQCALYKMSQQAKSANKLDINKQQIFIMDTPGINSPTNNKNSNMLLLHSHLILQKIQRKIQQEKLDIIGLVFLKNATDLRDDQNSSIYQIYKMFPIEKKIKQKISFFVFTNMDKQILNIKQFQLNLKSVVDKYQKQKINFFKNNQIRWISYPQIEQDRKLVLDFIQKWPPAALLFKNQWIQFGKNIKSSQTYNCTFFEFFMGNQIFKKRFQNLINESLQMKIQQTFNDKIMFQFKIKKIFEKKYNWNRLLSKLLTVSLGALFLVSFPAAALAEYIVLSTGAIAGSELIQQKLQQLPTIYQMKGKIQDNQKQLQKFLHETAVLQMKKYIVSRLLSVNLSDNQLYLKKTNCVIDITVYSRPLVKEGQKNQQYKKVNTKIQKVNDEFNGKKQVVQAYVIDITGNTEYKIEINTRRPSDKKIFQIIKKATLQTYFQQQITNFQQKISN